MCGTRRLDPPQAAAPGRRPSAGLGLNLGLIRIRISQDVDFINENVFLSAKPVVYLVNLSPEDYWRARPAQHPRRGGDGAGGRPQARQHGADLASASPFRRRSRKKNKWLAKINDWVQAHGGGKIIPFSGAFEQARHRV